MGRRVKVVAITEVNSHLLEVAAESPSDALDWDFYCECGRPDCHEQVMLTVAAFDWLRGNDLPILAPGHRMSQVTRARMLRSEAAALRAQAQLQAKRARRNLGA